MAADYCLWLIVLGYAPAGKQPITYSEWVINADEAEHDAAIEEQGFGSAAPVETSVRM